MKYLLIVFIFLHGSINAAAGAEISVDGHTVYVTGNITDDTAEMFFQTVDGLHINELVINSGGGEVTNSMQIASWMFDKKVDIIVKGKCFSSCANYLFPAANKKTILPGSLVAWHGSLTHEPMDDDTVLATIDQSMVDDQHESKTDRESVLANFKQYMKKGLEQQEAFFSKIGIDGRVCSIGDQYGASNFFILSVEDMNAFGITNIQASKDYHKTDLSKLNKITSFIYVEIKK